MKTTNQYKKWLAALMLFFGLTVGAQERTTIAKESSDYKNAFGVRGGGTSGLTYKHKFTSSNAFEGIISVWPYTIGLTGLYERNVGTGEPGLNFYYGLGGHVNSGTRYRTYYYIDRNREYVVRSTNTFALGIDGIVGLEYKFRPIPFALSLDLKPYIEGGNYGYTFFALDPGLGIKLAF